MSFTRIVTRTTEPRKPQTIDELKRFKCPNCGAQTDLDWAYIGGRGYVPHLVCRGTCDSYYITQIDDSLGRDYARYLLAAALTEVA
jgi:hypothetical protein